ncbi:hypothetical protein Back11_12000 [Paenibacillus baekrokdamisoli]|uniref:Uncharacterized protein n=1 Tax=Paenibacillus baekrokdamisoli TaxID=1712516 RepID=A0A3G9IUW2_9BACL|nr:RNA polymerase subunit sigma-24 [Paenibacillus baekrokdamisoli]MBB3070505.1 hypothetical protein [Paenibacillus baekrokdamisoli]BBH19855.1 hypothetical protein Back11_12000 [Paenibacillus baekrokdamisoli]
MNPAKHEARVETKEGQEMNEQDVIHQLTSYKRIIARIKLLENYSIGNGITVSRLNQDDHLQELHRKLKGMPSYMYLSKREQRLETTAHAYLTQYPAGVKAQLAAIPHHADDQEDEKLLRELRQKVEKVVEARTGDKDNFNAVIERISELQDLERKREYYEYAFEVLDGYKSGYGRMLQKEYGEGAKPADIIQEFGYTLTTYYRHRRAALAEYCLLTRGLGIDK